MHITHTLTSCNGVLPFPRSPCDVISHTLSHVTLPTLLGALPHLSHSWQVAVSLYVTLCDQSRHPRHSTSFLSGTHTVTPTFTYIPPNRSAQPFVCVLGSHSGGLSHVQHHLCTASVSPYTSISPSTHPSHRLLVEMALSRCCHLYTPFSHKHNTKFGNVPHTNSQ